MTSSFTPKALLFDVFGTCVDWRSTVTNTLHDEAHAALDSDPNSLVPELRSRASALTLEDWGRFAQEWRDSYRRFVSALATDPTIPFKTVDEHHLEALKDLVTKWDLDGLWSEAQLESLNLVWHRLAPWPDSAPGIKALNTACQTATLSNGNLSLLNDLRVHGSMDFTHVFSGETFGSYKPSPKVYLGAVEKLGLQPRDCAMVAAHLADLKAAKSNGLLAFYVERPLEESWEPADVSKAREEGWVDLWVSENEAGFLALASKLGIKT